MHNGRMVCGFDRVSTDVGDHGNRGAGPNALGTTIFGEKIGVTRSAEWRLLEWDLRQSSQPVTVVIPAVDRRSRDMNGLL